MSTIKHHWIHTKFVSGPKSIRDDYDWFKLQYGDISHLSDSAMNALELVVNSNDNQPINISDTTPHDRQQLRQLGLTIFPNKHDNRVFMAVISSSKLADNLRKIVNNKTARN